MQNILEKGKLRKFNTRKFPSPQLVLCEKLEKDYDITDINSLNEVLAELHLPKYVNKDSTLELLTAIKDLQTEYNLESNIDIDNYNQKIKELLKLHNEESETDQTEINLAKLKQTYKFINNLDQINIEDLICEKEYLQRNQIRIDVDDIQKIRLFIHIIKNNNSGDEVINELKNQFCDFAFLKYFTGFKDNKNYVEIIRDGVFLNKIVACSDSIEKEIILLLLKKKICFFNELIDLLNIERIKLLQIVISMANEDFIYYNRVDDSITLKK